MGGKEMRQATEILSDLVAPHGESHGQRVHGAGVGRTQSARVRGGAF